MKLNFALPHDTIYKGIEVESVVIPGESGEYGVTVNHVPIVSQLKPGVLQIVHSNAEVEKYFVAGGFALTHADSVTVSFHFRMAHE
jgi:F-type H+-transporting ATPase subunit delta